MTKCERCGSLIYADADKPVTEEWLLDIGFVPDGVHLVLRDWGPHNNGSIQVYNINAGSQWWVSGTRIETKAARGQVLALLAALAIPVAKKGTDNNG